MAQKKTVNKSNTVVKTNNKVNDILKECEIAINKEIAEEFRKEAKEIIKLTTDDVRNEFLMHYNNNRGNISCLVLDKAKYDLIAEGKLVSKDGDAFGKPFMM
jgi:hypothetical protein